MKRTCYEKLIAWKESRNRKPLILRGARQTGKTWLLKELGTNAFDRLAYVDLSENVRARSFFDNDLDIDRIVLNLSIETRMRIEPGSTLIVLDEVQECPRALTSLKYFQQNAPEYHVAAAGSYLGVARHEGESYPVGKVTTIDLRPLDFLEFMDAVGEGMLADLLRSEGPRGVDDAFSHRMQELLREYLFVGGMPEVVRDFAQAHDFDEVRRLQRQILADFDADFSKHAPTRILERMRLVWSSLPAQLAKENRKFVYGVLRPGARAREFEESIQWLRDYGAVTKIPRVKALRTPLAGYDDVAAFKLFCLDTGLMGALAGLPVEVLVNGSALFTEFKGAYTEQYVCQQLVAQGYDPRYWSAERSDAEVDFAVDGYPAPVPIEVKAAENLKAKSLKSARERFGLLLSVRTSLSPYRDEGELVNLPLWGVGCLRQVLEGGRR